MGENVAPAAPVTEFLPPLRVWNSVLRVEAKCVPLKYESATPELGKHVSAGIIL